MLELPSSRAAWPTPERDRLQASAKDDPIRRMPDITRARQLLVAGSLAYRWRRAPGRRRGFPPRLVP